MYQFRFDMKILEIIPRKIQLITLSFNVTIQMKINPDRYSILLIKHNCSLLSIPGLLQSGKHPTFNYTHVCWYCLRKSNTVSSWTRNVVLIWWVGRNRIKRKYIKERLYAKLCHLIPITTYHTQSVVWAFTFESIDC